MLLQGLQIFQEGLQMFLSAPQKNLQALWMFWERLQMFL